jgi:hypothetical protein
MNNNLIRIKLEEQFIQNFIKEYPFKEFKFLKIKSLLFALNSLRFIPHWDPSNTTQLTGLIEMMNYINEVDSSEKNMIEIGTFLGESASVFLAYKNIKKLYCIDNFWESKNIEILCLERLDKFIKENRCVIFKDKSKNVLNNIPKPIHIIYIDGSHTFKDVLIDLISSYNILEKKGFLCGHDYKNNTPEVKKAVNIFMEKYNFKNIKLFSDSSWCMQKI